MDVLRELALLTDAEAEKALQGLLNGLQERDPAYARILNSDEVADTYFTQLVKATDQASQAAVQQQLAAARQAPPAKAVRGLLVQATDNPELRQRLEDWLSAGRPSLFEPVTLALVAAGIVLVLSTSVEVDFKQDETGKRSLHVNVKRDATPNDTIKKVLDFLNPLS
jgi:hypothetical protein